MKFSTFYKILISHKKITKTVMALLCCNLLFAASNNEIVLKANTSIISSNAQCLSGNSFDFSSSSTISSGFITAHTWKFGDGKTATGPSVTHSYFSAGTFSVTLIVTSDNGCVDSISRTVTVYPQPLASFIIPANQCLTGNNFNFISTANIASNGSISSQIWNFGDGTTATGTSVNHSFSADGNYPVNLQISSDNGCIDIVTDTITVFKMPIVSIANNAAICSGNTISLSASTLAGTSPYVYTWTGPNGFNAAIANPSITNAGINANGTYSVSVSDSNFCSSSATTNIIVNQTPILSPITGALGGCVGSSINLANAISGGIWLSSNLSVATVNAASGQVNFLSNGNTTIQYTVTNAGCSSSISTNLISNSVSLHPDVIECNNGITHFSASDIYYGVSYSNNNPSNTYEWSITGGPFTFQGASNANSAYPNVQLQSGNAFTALVQFTSNGITCSATQMVYKNTSAADTIKGAHDTTVCNNTAPIQLSAVISAASNSFSWSSSGTGTFSNNTSLNTFYTPSAADKTAGTLKIYFTATSTLNSTGNCGTAYGKDSMILRIYPANMSANTSQTICSNQTILFTPVSSIPGSFYSWSSSVLSGTANGNSATGTGQINDSLVNTNNSLDATIVYNITPFAFTPTNTTCTGNPFNYTVIIKPQPSITITNNNPTICTGSNSNIQLSSSIVGNNYTWMSSVITGAVLGNSSNAVASTNNLIQDNLTNSFNADSKVRYYITVLSNSGCGNIAYTDVIVYAQPTPANAGTDQVLCNVTSSILSANIPGIGIGQWNQIAGPSTAIFGSPNSPFSTISGLVSGNYQLTWSITNGNCAVSTDTIQLINATETFGGTISGNNTVCAGLNSGTLQLTGYAGSIRGWEYSTDGGISWSATLLNTSNSYTYYNLTATTLYRAIVQNGTCSAVYSSVATITVNSPSIPGTLSADTIVCISSNSGSLTLNGYTGSILRWESSTDGGSTWPTIINNSSNNYSYTNLKSTTLYRAIIQNGTCSIVTSNAVNIKVSELSIPGSITANNIVCANNNNGLLVLSANNGNILNWESSSNSGASWSIISNNSNNQSYTNLTSTTLYRAKIQNGVCPSAYSNSVSITVLPKVSVANAGIDQKICNQTSTSLAANTPTSGSGNWTAVVTNPSIINFTNPNDPNSSVTGLKAGVYQFIWTISNAVCADSKDTVLVTIYPATNPGILSADATVCASSNNGSLTLNGYQSAILNWESSVDGSSWTNIVNSTNLQNYSNLNSSTYFRALVKNEVCPSLYSNSIRITVLPATTIADAGPDTTLINGFSSYRLNANNPSSGTGVWSVVAPFGPTNLAFTDASDPNATIRHLTFIKADSTTSPVTPPADGVYHLKWSISNGICPASESIMIVTVQPPTNPGFVGTDTIVCANNNTGIITVSDYFGDILQWEDSTSLSSSWHIITRTIGKDQDSIHFENLSITTMYRALVKNGVGLSLYSGIAATVTVLDPVSIADAGVDSSICNTTSIQLYGNRPTRGTGTWTSIANGLAAPIFSNKKDPKTIVNGLTIGTYQFVWTISNGSCDNSYDTVTIKIVAPSIPGNLEAAAIVCANNNMGTLLLKDYTGTIIQSTYSLDNGLNWMPISNSANKDSIPYKNLTSTTQFRTEIKNAVCPSLVSNIVTITVLQEVSKSNAGADQNICNQTTTNLSAQATVIGTGIWSSLSTNPTAVNIISANDPNTTITDLAAGTYQFVWTVSNKLCNDSKDTVQVIVYPETIAGNLVADNFVCTNLNSGQLVLSNNNGIIIQWETSIDNGVNWIALANTSNSFTYHNLTTSTNFRVLVSNGNCSPSYSNSVKINVTPTSIPGILISTDTLVCSNYNSGSIHLTGNNGTILDWEYSEDDGVTWSILNNSTADLQFINLTKSTIYRALIQSGVCTIAYSNNVKINVSIPTIPGRIIGNATVCKNSNTGKIVLTGNNGSILHWESSIDNGNTWTIIANSSNTINYQNLSNTTIYRAVIQNSVCSIAYTNSITVNTVQPVTIANAGPNQLICNLNTATTLTANNPIVGSGIWSFVKGPSEIFFTDAIAANTVINGLVPGTYQLAWTIDNGVCASSTSNMNIVVDKLKVDFSLNAINDCGSTTYQFKDASKVFYGIANWKWTSAPGDTITTKNFTKNYTQAGQNKVSLTILSNTGCSVTTGANFQVKVFDMPKASINAISEACKDQLLQLSSTLNSRDSIFSILWNLGNGINTKDSLVTVQYYSEGKYTIKLLVSTVNKCYDSSYKLITIRPLPVIIIPSENFVCKGDSIKLTATGASTYIWKDKQNNIICNSCETLNILPTANSTYSVIGYNQYGCSQIANTSVKIVHPLKINAVQLDTLCIGSSIKLNVTGAEKYLWQPDAGLSNYNSGTTIASPKSTTTYTVIGKDNQSCFADTAKIKLVVGNPTKINIGSDTTIQAGVPFRLAAMSYERENINKWQWSGNATFSCIDCQTTIAKIAYDGDIMVTATNVFGCYSRDTLSIKTFCPSTEVFIPNAFSPDGDGINDILYVQGSGIKIIKDFRIYSRWGELVFERTNFLPGDKSNGWDGKIRGKLASQDVFVYICEVVCEKGVAATFKGNIAVLK